MLPVSIMFNTITDKTFTFSPLPQSESEDHESSETLLPSPHNPKDAQYERGRRWRLSSLVAAISVSILLLSLSCLLGVWLGSRWILSQQQPLIEQISQYSPLLQDMDIRYGMVHFNGSLLKENIFRQPGSPEVDAAWASLGVDYRPMAVPAELAERSGLAPDQVKVNLKYGGGFPANVEGLHHLHCLNLVRQSLYYNYEYYHALGHGAFQNEDFVVRKHVSHCLDILRQQLMCTVDIAVLGQVWWNPGATDSPPTYVPEAYVDFNTEHKCRNFNDVRSWAEKRQMPEQVPMDWLQPPEPGDRIYEELP